MARFDVFTFNSKSTPLVLDVQADLLSDLYTRVVVPLRLKSLLKDEESTRLKPVFKVGGKNYIMLTTEIATIQKSQLGKKVGTLELQSFQIVDALDFLFQGF